MPDLDYQINITKAGSGATTATQEMQQLAAAEKEVTAAAKDATSATTQHEASQDKLAGTLAGMAARWLTVGAALHLVTGYTQEALKAAEDHELAIARLNGILQATGQYTDAASASMQRLAGALALQTGHTKEQVIAIEALLLSFGAAQKDIPVLTQLVLDLSAGLGKSLPEAAMMVGKALEGNFTAFHKLGVEVDTHKTLTENLNGVLSQLQGRFSGLSETMGDTAAGGMARFRSESHALQVELGEELLPTVLSVTEGLRAMMAAQRLAGSDAVTAIPERAAQAQSLDSMLGGMGTADATKLQARLRIMFGATANKDGSYDYPRQYHDGEGTGLNDAQSFAQMQSALEMAQRYVEGRTVTGISRSGGAAPSSAGAGAGGGSVTPGGSGNVNAAADAVNEEQQKAAEKLAALQEKMRTDALDGYAKELAVAEDAHAKRAAEIADLDHKAGASIDDQEVAEAKLANDEALYAAQRKVAAEQQAELDRLYEQQKRDQAKLTNEALKSFEEDLKIKMLTSSASRRSIADQEYQARLTEYQKLLAEGTMDEDTYTRKVQEASQKRAEFAATETHEQIQAWKQVGTTIEDSFANQASNAIVTFARTGHANLKQFFSDLFAMIAQAILQMEILWLIKTAVAGLQGGGTAGATAGVDSGAGVGPDTTGLAAEGTVKFAADGIMGMTSGPTLLPKFKVLAGEGAGGTAHEMLAVLARPQSVTVAGVQAALGDVGHRRMALIDAGALTRLAGVKPMASGGITLAADGFTGGSSGGGGGLGGSATIFVQLDPGLQARILEQSLAGVGLALTRPGPISTGVKNLAGGRA